MSALGPSELQTGGPGVASRVLAGRWGRVWFGGPQVFLLDPVDVGGQGPWLTVGPEVRCLAGGGGRRGPGVAGWQTEPPPHPSGFTRLHATLECPRQPEPRESSARPSSRGPFLDLPSAPEVVATQGHGPGRFVCGGKGGGGRGVMAREDPRSMWAAWRAGEGHPQASGRSSRRGLWACLSS